MAKTAAAPVLAEVDIRDAFFDRVYALAARDRNLIFLTDDMDAFSLRKFKQDLPEQFINIGVAEQNMINVAAGLAMCGKRVFAYGIASFVTMRCFEQIKINLCSMRLPVAIIGVGAGFSFGFDGPTHHATQDLAIMRALPEMTILNPSESALAASCADLAANADGPSYIRLDKGAYPAFPYDEADLARGFRIIRPSGDLTIVATGYMTSQAVQAAEALERQSIRAGVVDLFRLKPVDEAFMTALFEPGVPLVTLEDHSFTGGLGSLVAELAADRQARAPLKRLAIRDEQFLRYGSRDWLHALNGLNVEAVTAEIARWRKAAA